MKKLLITLILIFFLAGCATAQLARNGYNLTIEPSIPGVPPISATIFEDGSIALEADNAMLLLEYLRWLERMLFEAMKQTEKNQQYEKHT